MRRKVLTLCLSALTIASLLVSTALAADTRVTQSAQKAISSIESKYQAKGLAAIDDWTLTALSLLGEDATAGKWGGADKWNAELKARLASLDLQKTTDFARFVTAIAAYGEDPQHFAGTNLIDRLKKAQLTNGKFADAMNGEGQSLINAHVWSIIALHAAGEQIPREKLAKAWLVAKQLPDGGFQFATDAKTGGVDMTAMSLLAFRALGMDKTEEPVKKALAFLQKQQRDGGGFQEGGVVNAESVANVISALIAWGEKPEAWQKGNGSTIDSLLAFQKQDGSFSHTQSGYSNQIATAQAMLGLADLKRGSSYVTWLHEQSGAKKYARLRDIPRGYWAETELAYLVKHGYMQGVTTDAMQPNSRVTRAQFAALLLRVIGEEPSARAQGTFADVLVSDWTAPIVEKAAALGLMQGSQGKFNPQQGITHEEMATIVSRVAKQYGWQKTYPGAAVSISPNTVSTWAQAGVKDLQARKLLGGTADGKFSPKAAVNRAEAAVMLYRLLMTK